MMVKKQQRVRLSDDIALGLVHEIKKPGEAFDLDAKKTMYQKAVVDLVRAVNTLDDRAAEARDLVLEATLPGEALSGFAMEFFGEKVERSARLVRSLEGALGRLGMTAPDIWELNDAATQEFRTNTAGTGTAR